MEKPESIDENAAENNAAENTAAENNAAENATVAKDAAGSGNSRPSRAARTARAARSREPHPMLHQLADWHPQLFGARFLPLKVGIFEDLQARHPELVRDELKAALAWHARSTPYLESVAAGEQRHDLDGNAVEPVAPEHRHHAITETFRRRQHRTQKDLKPWLVERLVQAIDASGLDRGAYEARVHALDAVSQQALQDAFAAITERAAKKEAVRRAYAASGKSVEEFAQMYGLDEAVVREAVQ